MGSKNHEVVPIVLIVQISGLRSGGVNKLLGELAKRNLVAKVRNAKCELSLSLSLRHAGNKANRILLFCVLR
jgi:RIO-like serine/threonine protein kinase